METYGEGRSDVGATYDLELDEVQRDEECRSARVETWSTRRNATHSGTDFLCCLRFNGTGGVLFAGFSPVFDVQLKLLRS